MQKFSSRSPVGVCQSTLESGIGILPVIENTTVIDILKDNQGYQDLGGFGSPNIKTPHLDQMLTGVRSGKWKLVLPRSAAPSCLGWWARMIESVSEVSLYDLQSDPRETNNVVANNVDVVEAVMEPIDRAREELGELDRTGSGDRFFDKGPRKLQSPIKRKPSKKDVSIKQAASPFWIES